VKRAVFEIKQNPAGSYYFTFVDPYGKTLVISCNFPDRAELEICIARVRDSAIVANVYNIGEPGGSPPYFLLCSGADGIIFSLIGFKDDIIFSSVPYPNGILCLEAISVLKESSQKACINDLTVE